jgi:hypothetical protein
MISGLGAGTNGSEGHLLLPTGRASVLVRCGMVVSEGAPPQWKLKEEAAN